MFRFIRLYCPSLILLMPVFSSSAPPIPYIFHHLFITIFPSCSSTHTPPSLPLPLFHPYQDDIWDSSEVWEAKLRTEAREAVETITNLRVSGIDVYRLLAVLVERGCMVIVIVVVIRDAMETITNLRVRK